MRAIETLRTALAAIIEEEGLVWPAKTVIEPPRDPRHGDLSVNSAMLLAKEAKTNPRELAQKFAARLLERCPDVEKAEAAGPGFCNVTFSQAFWRQTVTDIESAGQAYGESSEPDDSAREFASDLLTRIAARAPASCGTCCW